MHNTAMSGNGDDKTSAVRERPGRAWLVFAAVAALLLAAVLYAAGDYGRGAALERIEADARTDAGLKVALLQAVLERPRALPLVLSADADLRGALATKDKGLLDGLDRKLESLIDETKASVIYVIGTDGVTVASSNWREETSFVGSSYAFRDYFRLAMRDGTAEHYALGSVSKRPGLYISRRVETAGGDVLGVVVVKVEFDGLEREWGASGKPTFVTDQSGIVLMTSRPEWRFSSIVPIAPDRREAIRDSLQFGEAPLTPLPFLETGDRHRGLITVQPPPDTAGPNQQMLALQAAVASTPWTLHLLTPVDAAARSGAWQSRMQALLILLPMIGLAAWLLYRRERALRRAAQDRKGRDELERRVIERTQALSLAGERLQAEIAGHRSTETKLQTVQQELVQANRLAILGQVAAGVAHEINQPVATIRAYADNARTFLDRGRPETAAENLVLIAGLTERIGTITDELKTLARKGRGAAEPIAVATVLEGALFLLRSRFSGRMDTLHIAEIPPSLCVHGNRIRLEQIFINLLQNALEAIGDSPGGRIDVSLGLASAGEVVIEVADNGPGIPDAILKSLFIPFNTSKDGGLGLGLVIAKDIAADYGGGIDVTSSSTGTTFAVTLKKADPA
ncbi:sensor histidine kinase [Rhizobium sp. CG5]|nr:sensor histidine kinase [Rhizobium sp. CG5]